jgi:hypothetical protein
MGGHRFSGALQPGNHAVPLFRVLPSVSIWLIGQSDSGQGCHAEEVCLDLNFRASVYVAGTETLVESPNPLLRHAIRQ